MKQVCLKYNAVAFAVTCLLAPTLVFASAQEDDSITTSAVVVTASRSSQDLLDVSSSMSIVNVDPIANGSDSIPELLSKETGVYLSSDGTPGVKRVSLRGESTSRTLILVDGQRSDDQKTRSGAPLLINPYFTDRVEILKGPASVLYGSDAIGGVVNVISKQASTKPFSIEGGVAYDGSHNGFSEFANISGTYERFKYIIGGFNSNQGDLYLSERRRLDNTSYNAHGANANFSYDLLDNVTIGYSLDYYNIDAETATTLATTAYSTFRGEIPKWERIKHNFYVKALDINDYLAAINASIYYQSNDKEFGSFPQKGLEVGVDNYQDTLGTNLQFEFSFGDTFYLITGYDGKYDRLESDSAISLQFGPMKGQINITDRDYEQTSHALYGLLSSYLTDELTLNTGLRYTYTSINGGNSLMAVTMSGMPYPISVPINAQDRSASQLVGSLGMVYRPFDHGAFRANWSQGFRSPNIQELYLITSTGTLQLGNKDLDNEKSNNYELGFRWDDPNGLIADIALFYSQASDYIDTYLDKIPGMPMEIYSYRNIAKANTLGSELSLSYAFDQGRYEPYLNLSILRREYETNHGSTTNTGTPRFSGNAGLRFNGQLFALDSYVKFASSTTTTNLDGTSHFGDVYYGGYATVNLRVSTSFGSNQNFKVFASCENILDKNYQTNELIHEPGRFFSVGLQGKF